MKGLGELLSDITIRTGSVNSTCCGRELTVTAILTGFEAVASTKIAKNCPTLTGARRPPRPLNGNLTTYPNTMSLTLQFALNCFKTYCLDIKIQAIKGRNFSSSMEKSILGCFHPFQNPTGTWILGMILR